MLIREISGPEGILPHIDLLKFDDVVLGISLLSEATMIFRQLTSIRVFVWWLLPEDTTVFKILGRNYFWEKKHFVLHEDGMFCER